jgi:LuxR family maltose regulon positive regulatory protein
MVIITREDPQFPLSRLRANGRITEIRMVDLSFSENESDEFYLKAMGIRISSRSTEKITRLTEGWVAGMQLAGLLFKGLGEEQIEEAINKFNGNHSYIIDYLVEEVLNRQKQEIRDFLRKTCILERMNAELCDELTGRNDSRSLLNQLEKANLFLIPLDAARDWYRYHHLFADSLRIELSKEDKRSLYRKSALWMQDKGFYQEAVSYAFKSQDMKLALSIVENNTKDMFQNAQVGTLVKWLEILPDEMVKESEILSVRKSIALFISGRVREALEHLKSLGEDFEYNTSPHNRGLMLSLKALVASY